MTNTKEKTENDVSSEFDFEGKPKKLDFNDLYKKKYYRVRDNFLSFAGDEFFYTSIYDLCSPYDLFVVNPRRAKSIIKKQMIQNAQWIEELIKTESSGVAVCNIDNMHKAIIEDFDNLDKLEDDQGMVCLLSGGGYGHSTILIKPDELLEQMEDTWGIIITEATKEEFYQYVALTQQETD
ncbi:hypothetical protein ACQ9ZH_21045 [Pseudomonas chlororaphis]